MAYTITLRSIYLKNFIGIQTGLGKKELEVDFTKMKNKNIILIVGENGTGKTTFLSVLHCLPGTTDNRQKIILDDKEGIKKVTYYRNDGNEFICKIVYTPNKIGGHNCKGFITKIDKDGNEFSLNENGNITSYREIVNNELGLSDNILALANQNDTCKGLVDMTSTQRKLNMSSFLPDDIYSNFYNIVDTTFRELRFHINVLVDELTKLHDEETLKSELNKITSKINDLVEKRDKCTAKISEFKTKIKMLDDLGIDKKEKEIQKEIELFSNKIKTIDTSDITIGGININSSLSPDEIDSMREEIKDIISGDKAKLESVNNDISSLTQLRNSISEQISDKESVISEISTNKTYDELEEILEVYKAKAEKLEKYVSKVTQGVTKDTYLTGYEIIKNIKKYVDKFGDYDVDLVKAVCGDKFIEFDRTKLLSQRNELQTKLNNLNAKIESLDNDDNSDSILDKRPHQCSIDDCPFIANALKLSKLHENLPNYLAQIVEINNSIDKINDKLNRSEDVESIKNLLNMLYSYVTANSTILSKLPNNKSYTTLDGLKKIILSGGNELLAINFDENIENIEYAEEYTNLIVNQIPNLESKMEILRSNKKLIDSVNSDLEKLKKNKSEIIDKLSDVRKSKERLDFEIGYYENGLVELDEFIDRKTAKEDYAKKIAEDVIEIDDIKDKVSQKHELIEKLEDRKIRLDEIESQLDPLTKKRDLYYSELLRRKQIIEIKEQVEKDYSICEIIRASLSMKDDGIPVFALEWFMDSIRQNANVYLSKAFYGNLQLDEFIINKKDFIIPYHKCGEYGMDVSYSSSSERSFISLCLTMAIIEQIVTSYSIICLDEIDKGFSSISKNKFIEILTSSCSRAGITQLFMITHNASFYNGYDNIGYIIFPGADVNEKELDKNNSIYVDT